MMENGRASHQTIALRVYVFAPGRLVDFDPDLYHHHHDYAVLSDNFIARIVRGLLYRVRRLEVGILASSVFKKNQPLSSGWTGLTHAIY
jgi:hypothetical protein